MITILSRANDPPRSRGGSSDPTIPFLPRFSSHVNSCPLVTDFPRGDTVLELAQFSNNSRNKWRRAVTVRPGFTPSTKLSCPVRGHLLPEFLNFLLTIPSESLFYSLSAIAARRVRGSRKSREACLRVRPRRSSVSSPD